MSRYISAYNHNAKNDSGLSRTDRGANDVLSVLSCHVETIALLQKSNRKSKPDTYVKLSLDMEDYYRIMDAEKVGK